MGQSLRGLLRRSTALWGRPERELHGLARGANYTSEPKLGVLEETGARVQRLSMSNDCHDILHAFIKRSLAE